MTMLHLIPQPPGSSQAHERKVAISSATSQFLDFSRWIAAFFVVFSHVRSIVLANYPDVTSPSNVVVKAIYFAAGFGHISVVIFFVISGFLVGGRATLKGFEGRFSLLDYAVHRFARIYIVLVPALLIGLVWDHLGAFVDNFGLYTYTSSFHWWMIDYPIIERLNMATFFGNLFMLQTIFVDPLGSNGPLWSLANEWWYYIVFGLGIAVYIYKKRAIQIACCCGIACLFWMLPLSITIMFTLWLLGVGVAVLEQRWQGWPGPIGVAVLLAVMVAERYLPAATDFWQQFFLDVLVAVAFSFSLLCAKRGRWAVGNLHPWLASFSYTTYLVHAPAMAMIVALIHRQFGFGIGEQPGVFSVAFMVALIGILYLYAWIFAYFSEARTDKARKWLARSAARFLPSL
jgi:peptidoglycan/LPS O-acetylase OafA/YrhL